MADGLVRDFPRYSGVPTQRESGGLTGLAIACFGSIEQVTLTACSQRASTSRFTVHVVPPAGFR